MHYKNMRDFEFAKLIYELVQNSEPNSEIEEKKLDIECLDDLEKKSKKKVQLYLEYEKSSETAKGEWYSASMDIARLDCELIVERFVPFDGSDIKYVVIINPMMDDPKMDTYFRKVEELCKKYLKEGM